MTYIDMFVAAVPTARKKEYVEFCRLCAQVFKDHGVIEMVDCWEAEVPDGKVTSFPLAVKQEPGESVAVSWMIWPDKETRDKGNQAVMEDERFRDLAMPFDGVRVILGSFTPLLAAED